jgi:hypothetical protein
MTLCRESVGTPSKIDTHNTYISSKWSKTGEITIVTIVTSKMEETQPCQWKIGKSGTSYVVGDHLIDLKSSHERTTRRSPSFHGC